MVNTRGWRLVGASMCAAGLILAGCGNGSDPADDSDSGGPLAEFFGWDDHDYRGDGESSEEERQQHYQVEEYVVTCMQEAGFEYFPQPFWGDRDDVGGGNDPWEEAWKLQEEDPEAYAKQYGYAITTLDYGDESGRWEDSDDPNWEYRESLSPAAQEEYEKALWGDWEAYEEEFGEEGDDGAFEVGPGELGGCQNEAYEEVYDWGGDDWEDEQERFQPLWDEWDTLHERIEKDARMVEVMQAWSTCMADAGYPGLESLWDGQEQVHERQSELYGWDEPTVEEGFYEEDPDGDQEPYEPYEPDPTELAALRDFELAIAWADYECKQEHDVDRREREVRYEHEEQFIESHRAALEEYRDWMNERDASG